MYRKMDALGGRAKVRVSGAMSEGFINSCASNALPIISARRISGLELELVMPTFCLEQAQTIAVKTSCEIRLMELTGRRRWGAYIRRRLFPAVLALCLVALLFWSKFFVWEIEVSGNERVSTGEILNALDECGVECGAFWPAFYADNIRSEVLAQIPELSWITVNMHGSLAEVIAVERTKAPEMVFEGACADIVASGEGFIRSVNTLVGQSAVKPGNVVHKGDILISGALESSFSPPRFVRACGSVTAEINREITAVLPENECVKRYEDGAKNRYALIIGNNRINFYSGSSISDGFCDKIISVWKLEVKGLFSLPVSIVRERENYYETEYVPTDVYEAGVEIEKALRDSFDRSLGNGELLGEKLSFGTGGGLLTGTLRVRAVCEIGTLSPISESRRAEIENKYTEKVNDDKWQNEE